MVISCARSNTLGNLIMMPISLHRKATLFILVPTFLILVVMGIVGLNLVRNALLDQWQQTAVAKLQRSAHYVDMRLMRPRELLLYLHEDIENTASQQTQTYDIVINQLRALEGVVRVRQEWYDQVSRVRKDRMKPRNRMRRTYHHLERLDVTSPRYDTEFKNETVSLYTYFKDENDTRLGHIEVVISFYDLIGNVVEAPWWKSNKAFVVDQKGKILTSTLFAKGNRNDSDVRKLGEEESLGKEILEAMHKNSSGTVLTGELSQKEIGGYYRLSEAPWSLIVIAPGREVLKPIIIFRNYYFAISAIGILLVMLVIRTSVNKTTTAIKKVTNAANDLANGHFGSTLIVRSSDEVGELTHNFNMLSQQLKERIVLQEAMNVAGEIQKNLLPRKGYITEGLEINGAIIYCQETGGDFYDLLPDYRNDGKVRVVVGDVVGHGIGAALLMATVRALLRSRSGQPGGGPDVICDVNKHVCFDTLHSGDFVTLFFLTIDREAQTISWIRCGHEPAIVYFPESGCFSELRGEGLTLGVDATYSYREHRTEYGWGDQIILLGSDGVWDVENNSGERFGRERVKSLLGRYHMLSPDSIIQNITQEINLFRGKHPQNDDITLVVIKIDAKSGGECVHS